MKRLILAFCAMAALGLAPIATAGDYHSGTELVCSDCHIAHWSQQHGYSPTNIYVGILGPAGPYDRLLRDDVNELCLSCHNNNSYAPDVMAGNNGKYAGTARSAGGLNADAAHNSLNDAGYEEIDGHTLWSTATAPGGTWKNTTTGLECTDCHSQHGGNTWQYRNLQTSTSTTSTSIFKLKHITYAIASNDLSKDVFEATGPKHYGLADINYNEPDETKSAYANWCKSCHTAFHGAGGDANMGGQSGGWLSATPVDWKRHPTADVDIGHAGSSTRVSSLPQFVSHTNKVRVMNINGIWDGTDNNVTPSCFSCHMSHGNQNGFGLIFMNGTGTVSEQGDGGVYKDLCRQCHVQGA